MWLIRKAKGLIRRMARVLMSEVSRWRHREFFRFYRALPRIRQELCWCGGQLIPLPACPVYGICHSCGTYILSCPPNPGVLADIYSLSKFWRTKAHLRGIATIEERSSLYLSDGRVDFWLWVIQEYAPPHGQVVEVGCAPGILLKLLHERGYKCMGVEIAEEVANWVREHTELQVLSGAFPNVSLLCCDLFLAFDVLEHCHDPVGFMMGVRDTLNSGGIAIIQSPIVRPAEGYDTMRPFGSSFERMFDGTEHIVILSSIAIQRLAKLAGLRVMDNGLKWHTGHEIVVLQKPYDRE